MNKKIIATATFFILMSLGQLLEGGVLSFIFLLGCALLIAQLDKELKSRVLDKVGAAELPVRDIDRSLTIKLVAGFFVAALLASPQQVMDKSSALTKEEKKEVKDFGHLAKQFCHVYIKTAMKDKEDASVSFPHTSRQYDNQTYVTNAISKHENVFGGKTKLEWDCQIHLDNPDNAGKFESWELEVLENRAL